MRPRENSSTPLARFTQTTPGVMSKASGDAVGPRQRKPRSAGQMRTGASQLGSLGVSEWVRHDQCAQKPVRK